MARTRFRLSQLLARLLRSWPSLTTALPIIFIALVIISALRILFVPMNETTIPPDVQSNIISTEQVETLITDLQQRQLVDTTVARNPFAPDG